MFRTIPAYSPTGRRKSLPSTPHTRDKYESFIHSKQQRGLQQMTRQMISMSPFNNKVGGFFNGGPRIQRPNVRRSDSFNADKKSSTPRRDNSSTK